MEIPNSKTKILREVKISMIMVQFIREKMIQCLMLVPSILRVLRKQLHSHLIQLVTLFRMVKVAINR